MEDLQKDNIENATQEIVNCGDFAPKMKNLARDVEVAGAQLTSLGSQLAAIGKMLQQSELLGVLLALNRISGEIRGFPESGEVHEAIGHKEEHPWSAVLQKICGVIKNPPKNETPSHQYEELQKMNEDERQKNEEWKKKYDALNNEYKNKCGEFLLKADNLTRAYNKIAVLEDSNSRLKEENLSLDKENERLNDEKTSMEKKAESLELRIKELENDLEKNQSLVDVLNGRIDTINDEKHKLAAKLDRKEGELNTAREQNAALDAQMPPNAPELKEIAEKLEQIPANFRGLASGYYNLEQFPVFLSQSGQYNLLTQFWEGCFDKCRNGAEPGNIADFLQLLLRLYNAANPASQFSINFPKPGDIYDYTSQLRNGNNGQRVQRPLLPGLVKPNGEHAVKALVDVI